MFSSGSQVLNLGAHPVIKGNYVYHYKQIHYSVKGPDHLVPRSFWKISEVSDFSKESPFEKEDTIAEVVYLIPIGIFKQFRL
jgi:hypothetical protein